MATVGALTPRKRQKHLAHTHARAITNTTFYLILHNLSALNWLLQPSTTVKPVVTQRYTVKNFNVVYPLSFQCGKKTMFSCVATDPKKKSIVT